MPDSKEWPELLDSSLVRYFGDPGRGQGPALGLPRGVPVDRHANSFKKALRQAQAQEQATLLKQGWDAESLEAVWEAELEAVLGCLTFTPAKRWSAAQVLKSPALLAQPPVQLTRSAPLSPSAVPPGTVSVASGAGPVTPLAASRRLAIACAESRGTTLPLPGAPATAQSMAGVFPPHFQAPAAAQAGQAGPFQLAAPPKRTLLNLVVDGNGKLKGLADPGLLKPGQVEVHYIPCSAPLAPARRPTTASLGHFPAHALGAALGIPPAPAHAAPATTTTTGGSKRQRQGMGMFAALHGGDGAGMVPVQSAEKRSRSQGAADISCSPPAITGSVVRPLHPPRLSYAVEEVVVPAPVGNQPPDGPGTAPG